MKTKTITEGLTGILLSSLVNCVSVQHRTGASLDGCYILPGKTQCYSSGSCELVEKIQLCDTNQDGKVDYFRRIPKFIPGSGYWQFEFVGEPSKVPEACKPVTFSHKKVPYAVVQSCLASLQTK